MTIRERTVVASRRSRDARRRELEGRRPEGHALVVASRRYAWVEGRWVRVAG